MSTAIERVEGRSFDLTQAPWRQWDKQMVDLMKATVLPKARDDGEVYYCLAVADSLGLNPFAQEVFFIPQKGRDGDAGGVKPYIGREGLVKKAAERGYYFESETVREKDRFRVARKSDGTRTVTHSYGHENTRGAIVGAYAFLHSMTPGVQPAFFYAPLAEYLPTFDVDWKMGKSPWGNQRSSMIEKCAMIGAGRKRLNLAGVLVDAEVDRVQQQGAAGPGGGSAPGDFPWDTIGDDTVRDRLRDAVFKARERNSDEWPPAKCEMVFTGRSVEELAQFAETIERESATRAAPFEPETADEDIPDAVVVDDEVDELRRRERHLASELPFSENGDVEARIRSELETVRTELRRRGGEAPGQDALDLP